MYFNGAGALADNHMNKEMENPMVHSVLGEAGYRGAIQSCRPRVTKSGRPRVTKVEWWPRSELQTNMKATMFQS